MSATEAELGWFAGMLEGEGCISFFKQARSQKKGNGSDIICGLQITNTDINLINKLVDILKKSELSWFLRNKKVYSTKHAECFYIECRQQGMIIKSLELLLPYMYGNKKSKGQLVLDYLLKRREQSQNSGKFNTRYSKNDFSMIPRDSTLSSSRGEDIVHTT